MSPAPRVQHLVLQPGDRRATLALPPGDAGDRPLPLVLALHYAGHGAPFYGRGVLEGLVAPALASLGALIAAPDCPAPDWTHPRSEEAVLALLEHLLQAYPVDAHRTLVTGYSLGGNGAWHLATRHPGRFAAALVMAGWPPPHVLGARAPIPLYVLHSRQDEVVPLAQTERAVRQLQAQGDPAQLVVLEGITHYETFRYVEPLRAAVPWIEQVWAAGRTGPEPTGGTPC